MNKLEQELKDTLAWYDAFVAEVRDVNGLSIKGDLDGFMHSLDKLLMRRQRPVDPDEVKLVRRETGAPTLDCIEALKGADQDEAIRRLRKRGQA
jgi:hypothetical protein